MSLSSILVFALLGNAQQPAAPAADALEIQVVLDRAGFATGSIDGHMGRNTQRALELFQAQGGNPATDSTEALTRYVVTAADVSGPYTPDIPRNLVEQSKLMALDYRTIVEALVWIDISKEHYGIHGTPEPEAIGRTESHGGIRLTNWDALKLAGLVKPGTRVVFTN